MSRRSLRSLLRLAVIALLPGCGPAGLDTMQKKVREEFPTVRQLPTEELAHWLDDPNRPQPVLLDVRKDEEYAVSHLKGARRVDPEGEDLSALEGVSKEAPLVLYCSVGYRSSRLARQLSEQGYRDVHNLDGSIFRWANEGRPVYRDGQPVSEVHPYDGFWGRLLNEERRAETP